MTLDLVRVRQDGPVTQIGINRPQVRNAVNRPTADDLAQAFRDFEADPEPDPRQPNAT